MRDKAERIVSQTGRGNLAETAYVGIRDMILRGELAPEDRVLENDCAERLGISRTPVREAIARLASEGLIGRGAGGAPRVNRISADAMFDILHVRRLLEIEAARRACTASARGTLIDLRHRLLGYLDAPDVSAEDHQRTDEELHACIARMAESPMLGELIANLRLRTRVFDKKMLPGRFEPGCREHIAIIDAILNGDADAAGAAMKKHLDNAVQSIIDHLNVQT